MTPHWREWLPPEAALRPKVREVVISIFDAWKAEWFSASPYTVANFGLSRIPHGRDDGIWRAFHPRIKLNCRSRSQEALLERALQASVSLSATHLTSVEQDTLKRFEKCLLSDLSERFANALIASSSSGAKGDMGEDGSTEVHLIITVLDGGGSDLLSIAIPYVALVPFIKRTLSSRTPVARESVKLASLLSEYVIDLEVIIGHSQIRAGDLHELVPGDVVLLHSTASTPCELRVKGSRKRIGSVQPIDQDGVAALVVHDL